MSKGDSTVRRGRSFCVCSTYITVSRDRVEDYDLEDPQNDLRVIVNERKVLKSNLFLNRRNKTNKTNLNPEKYINNTLAGQCPSR